MRNEGLKEFAQYASLNVLGMVGLSCYILADTFFIAQGLGANGLTALNLVLPIYSVVHGVGLMIGMGGGIRYAIFRGRGDEESARRVFSVALALASAFSVLFFAVGLFFAGDIARLMGAQGEVFEMSQTYLQVLLLFSPAFVMNNVLLCFLRNDGGPQRAMIAMTVGSFANIVLDYILIFPCQMGILGAVLATGLSPIISMAIQAPHYKKTKTLRLTRIDRKGGQVAGSIMAFGLPSFITEMASGVVMTVFNMIFLDMEGNVGVAAYGVIANISMVVISVFTGLAQGVQPIISRRYGEGDLPQGRRTLRYALVTVLALSAVMYGAIALFAPQIATLFNSEQNALLQSLSVQGLQLYFLACPFAGAGILYAAYFAAVGKSAKAQLLAILRGLVLIVPIAVLFWKTLGVTGVWCAFPVTELLACAVAVWLYARSRRSLT